MLNFVICDDDIRMIEKLSSVIEKVLLNHDYDAKIVFKTTNYDKLLEYISSNNVNVVFLDIEFSGCKENGLDIAKKIRKINKNCYLIFVTSHFEYIVNAYKFKTFDYIFKSSIDIENISSTLKRLFDDIYDIEPLDVLDKQTFVTIYHYIGFAFLCLIIELLLTAFYIDKIPVVVTIFNFCLIFSIFLLSLFILSRVITLETTKKSLQSAEEYNKSLTILYDEVKGFNHDFKNIVSAIDGYICTNNIDGLKKYIDEVKEDCKLTNNLSILNPRIINEPGIYSLLNNKYFKATNAGIKFDLEFFLDLTSLKVNNYKFSRVIGILLDNAIEEAEKCDEKIIRVSFRREEKNHRAIIKIENTYTNKDVNIDDIFKKGFSGKENHSGIGLWEVRKYIKNRKNSDLFTSKNDKFFSQELTIYDTK